MEEEPTDRVGYLDDTNMVQSELRDATGEEFFTMYTCSLMLIPFLIIQV